VVGECVQEDLDDSRLVEAGFDDGVELDCEGRVLLDRPPRHDAQSSAGGEDTSHVFERRFGLVEAMQRVLTCDDVEGLVIEWESRALPVPPFGRYS